MTTNNPETVSVDNASIEEANINELTEDETSLGYIENIENFPTPKNISDIRSWAQMVR